MPHLTQRYWTLHGVGIRVQSPEAVDHHVTAILEYHGFETVERRPSTDDWPALIEITSTLPDVRVPESAAADPATGLAVFRRSNQLVVSGDDALAVVKDGAAMRLLLSESLVGTPRRLNSVLYFALTFPLLAVLQRHDLFAVHGAALALSESRGLLLVGDSDTGKSTLTMTLISAGWRYLSDDSFFLRPVDQDAVEALPFRRDFGLDPDARAMFPEIGAVGATQLTDPEKLRVRASALFPDQQIPRCRPTVLLFPGITGNPTSELHPLGKTEALRRLMTQSSFVDLDAELARRQLETLQQTVRQAESFELAAGRDVKGNPDAADALLRPLVDP